MDRPGRRVAPSDREGVGGPLRAGEGAGGPTVGRAHPIEVRRHGWTAWLLVAALSLRALLSFADAWSLAARGVRFVVVPVEGAGPGGGAPFTTLLWGLAALVAAITLARGLWFGWLLGAATCVVYLVDAIGDVSTYGAMPATLDVWALFVIDLGVPAVVLALLFAAHPWPLPARSRALGSPRARPVGRRGGVGT